MAKLRHGNRPSPATITCAGSSRAASADTRIRLAAFFRDRRSDRVHRIRGRRGGFHLGNMCQPLQCHRVTISTVSTCIVTSPKSAHEAANRRLSPTSAPAMMYIRWSVYCIRYSPRPVITFTYGNAARYLYDLSTRRADRVFVDPRSVVRGHKRMPA